MSFTTAFILWLSAVLILPFIGILLEYQDGIINYLNSVSVNKAIKKLEDNGFAFTHHEKAGNNLHFIFHQDRKQYYVYCGNGRVNKIEIFMLIKKAQNAYLVEELKSKN